MFTSPIPRLRVPHGWTLHSVDADALSTGRYGELLARAHTFPPSEIWFQLAVGPRAIALVGGVTRAGRKALTKDPARMGTFNQHMRVRAWHIEDLLSTLAGEFTPVAPVAVLPYGWALRDIDPGVTFTSVRALRRDLTAIDRDHASWRPHTPTDWETAIQAVTLGVQTPPIHDLVHAGDTGTTLITSKLEKRDI